MVADYEQRMSVASTGAVVQKDRDIPAPLSLLQLRPLKPKLLIG